MPPVHLLIKPASSLCNMRCRYCFYCDVAENRNTVSYGIMLPEITEAMIQNVFRYAESSVSFSFQGGEPTLAQAAYYRHFHETVDKYNRKQIPVSYSMQTNGCCLPSEMYDIFRQYHYLVGVSLDGTGKVHDSLRLDNAGEGTFRRVNETLKKLDAHGIAYNILCVITAQVAAHGSEIYRYFRSRGFRYLQFIPYVPDFGMENQLQPYALQPAQYARFLSTVFRMYYEDFCKGQYISIRQFDNFVRLAAGLPPECCGMDGKCYANLVVEADGSVYPCDFYVLDSWRMGNITTDSMEELLVSDTAKTFTALAAPIPEECRICPCYPVCRGGCRRHRERGDGTLGKNRYCEAYLQFFTENAPKLNELAIRLRRNIGPVR